MDFSSRNAKTRIVIAMSFLIFTLKVLYRMGQDPCRKNCSTIHNEFDLINCLDSCAANADTGINVFSYKFLSNIMFVFIGVIFVFILLNKLFVEKDENCTRLLRRIFNRNRISEKDDFNLNFNYAKLPEDPDDQNGPEPND